MPFIFNPISEEVCFKVQQIKMAHLQFLISIILLVSSAFGYRISQTDQKVSTFSQLKMKIENFSENSLFFLQIYIMF